MTRSALLYLLANPAALTGADVRELEQLAQAFPYCQTAHLLLAKAAHDQDSMLAGQRLRRAATYATDRTRLRQLIELPPTVAEPAPVPVEASLAATPQEHPVAADTSIAASPSAEERLPSPEVTAPAPPPAALETEPVVAPLAELLPEVPVPDDELPAVAPPIRPPAEAEAARFEFGLADAEPADIVAYQLPELEPLPAAAPESQLPAPLVPFKGAADVGYAPGEGSRLGFCLQGMAAEYSLTSGPAALLPGAILPPTGEFFEPDALLLAHLAAQQELPAAPAPAARDLINTFLQRAPQGAPRRRALPPPPDAEDENQPDLSGPSTRTVPDLASENLAKILTRQGKPDRAIAIYERLMVKHPEKMAYFAAQIESLRPQA